MSDPIAGATKSISGLFSGLEKATESTTFLLIFAFTILIDSGLLFLNGYGIISLIKNPDLIKSNVAIEIFLIFVFFSFFMSTALPIFGPFVYNIILHILWRPWFWLKNLSFYEDDVVSKDNRFHSKIPYGHVPIHELSNKAHQTRDAYYLALLKDAEERHVKRHNYQRNLSLSSIAAITVCLYNFYKPNFGNSLSILQYIFLYLGSNGYVFLVILIGLLSTIAFGPMFMDDDIWTVYCPSLAEERAERHRQVVAEKQRFRDEMMRVKADRESHQKVRTQRQRDM